MGTGSFPGVKQSGRDVDLPSPSSAEVEGRVELYVCFPSGPSWPVLWWPLPLPFYTFRGFISCLYVVTLSCVLFTRHKHMFGFLSIYFYTTLRVTVMLPLSKPSRSVGHKLMCSIQFTLSWFPWTVLMAYSKAAPESTCYENIYWLSGLLSTVNLVAGT